MLSRCSACGRSPDNPAELMLARNHSGRWVTLCAECRRQGVDPLPLSTAAAPPSGDGAGEEDTFANVGRLLARLRAARRKPETRDHARDHERHAIELPIRFKFNRDDAFIPGVVRNISRGGLLLTTKRPLERGQHLLFDPEVILPPALAGILAGIAEVRRAETLPDGQCEAGIRFVRRVAAKGENRRRHKRYQCAMRAYILREGSSIHIAADVKDISQGGVRLRLDEPLTDMETIEARIRGDAGAFTRGDLAGTLQVRRAFRRDGEWEAGCMFMRTRIEPRPIAAPPRTKAAAAPPPGQPR